MAKPTCSLACFFLTKLIALVPGLPSYMVAQLHTYPHILPSSCILFWFYATRFLFLQDLFVPQKKGGAAEVMSTV